MEIQLEQPRMREQSYQAIFLLPHSLGTRLNTNSPSASVVTVVRNHLYMCAHAVLTSRGYYSRLAFISFKSFKLCDYCSRAVSI